MHTRGSVHLALSFFLSLTAVSAQENRITKAPQRHETVKLTGNIHPDARPELDGGPLPAAHRITGVTLALKPSAEQQSALDRLLAEQRDPSSPNYERWLTPEEFADRFGASPSDIAQLSDWLRSAGFTVEDTSRGRNWITFAGTSGQFEAAFQTKMRRFNVEGEMHFANASEPSVPAAFAGVIAELRGLDDFRLKPHVRRRALAPDYTSGSSHYLAPDDVSTLYNISPLYGAGFTGAGQSIVIAGQTDINLADIQSFQTLFGLPVKSPQLVLTGADPGTVSGDNEEASLDLEWSNAVARNANIIYVYSKNVLNSVQYAISQNLAPVISLSYGGCEKGNSASYRSVAQQANAQGITWLNSSGDTGAAGCESNTAKIAGKGLYASFPASIPEITAVGGTEFNETGTGPWNGTNGPTGASVTSYIPEKAWNDTAERNELSATGGGASILFAKPYWQTGPGVPADNARDIPDLSLSASPDHDGYLFYVNGALGVVGGTSVSTPAFAGMVSLLNQYLASHGKTSVGVANINPTLYSLAQTAPAAFHDVTLGNNIVPCTVGTYGCTTGTFGYSAGPGYDLATGLGSVNAFNLITSWGGSSTTVGTTTTLTASPATIATGASTTLTAVVKPVSGATVPTGSVTFTSGATTLATVALSAGASGATASTAVASTQLVTGSNTITAKYSGAGTFASSSGTAAVTVTPPTTGNSQVVPSVNRNPVVQTAPDAQGYAWAFTITLTEQAGNATTLTGFTVNGTNYSSYITSFFGTNKITAKGSIAASLRMKNVQVPTNIVFGFSGQDANGHAWTQSISVPFK